MERRDFLKLCSVAGLGVASSQLPGTIVDAQAQSNFGKFVVFVNAGGGWDTTLVGNPKGNTPNSEGIIVNEGFAPGDIGQAGNLIYAPVGYNQPFFDQYYQHMTVINGIDCETNGHDTGQINTWSGRLQQQSPCLAALIAAVYGGVKPLSFITNGGYDSTFGVPVSKTRLNNANSLQPLIFPNRLNAGDPESQGFHTEETFKRIQDTRQARLQAMQDSQNLPRLKKSMNLLYTARLGMDELQKINDFLPDDIPGGMAGQAYIALAAWMAGLCQTATMSTGGFDTHGAGTDDTQAARTTVLFQGVESLINRADELGIADQLLIVIGSEFGRTPNYNGGGGKDHWSVGELIVMDMAGDLVPGNRRIGATDEFDRYERINPDTLAVDSGGVAMKMGHVHKWLRRITGIEDNEIVKLFQLRTEEYIDLSGPVG